MLKARIKYNEEFDAFDVEINTGDGWDFSKRYNCHTSTRNPMGNANFISWTILREIRQLEELGYKVKIDV